MALIFALSDTVFCVGRLQKEVHVYCFCHSQSLFLAVNHLFSEGIKSTEAGSHFSRCRGLINTQNVQTRHQGFRSVTDQPRDQESVHRDVCFHIKGEGIPDEGASYIRVLMDSKYRASACSPGMVKPGL